MRWSICSLETVASCQSTTIKRASVQISRSHASSIEPVTTSRDPWTERDLVQKNSSQLGFSVTARIVRSIIRGTLRACDERDLFVLNIVAVVTCDWAPSPVDTWLLATQRTAIDRKPRHFLADLQSIPSPEGLG